MATLTYLNPTTQNLSTHLIEPEMTNVTRLSFSRNNRPIIYTNYPEQIGESGKGLALAEYGYCVNQQTVTAGEAQVFFSHWNKTGTTLKYRIQIYNLSSGTATIQRTNCGFSTGWSDPGQTVKDFYNSTSTTITVGQGLSGWITPEYSIASNTPFNGLVRFTTNKAVVVTLYAYYNFSAIDGTEVVFPYSSAYSSDQTVYSGIGNGFFLTASHGSVRISNLPYRYITNLNLQNDSEMTTINIVGTTLKAEEDAEPPLNNLGNWCTQNRHVITFINDTTTSKTIYGYIGSGTDGNTSVIAQGTNIQSAKLETPKIWKWCKIVLSAGESYTFDYQSILASYGVSITFHEWSLSDRMA